MPNYSDTIALILRMDKRPNPPNIQKPKKKILINSGQMTDRI